MTQAENVSPASKMSGFNIPPRREIPQEPAVETKSNGLDETEKEPGQPSLEQELKDKVLSYDERLKLLDISTEDAMQIIDDMVVKFKYTEVQQLSARVSVVFSTRSTRFNNYLAKQLDVDAPKRMGRMNQLMSELQLACSLDKYGLKVLPVLNEKDEYAQWVQVLEERVEFVRSLASPVFISLCQKLMKFDLKLTTVFSEGYEENF
jgi:hypothetical protein